MKLDLINGGNYAILPANIRYDKNLTDSEKLLFCELTALSNKNGYCYAGNKYLSEVFGVTKETISRRLSRLEKKGYIKSKIIRNGKEITARHIYPLMDTSIPIDANVNTPIDDTVMTPIDANVKENNLSTNNLSTNNLNSNAHLENAIESDFEEWWNLYDKKLDKKKSFTVFKKCHKEHGYEKILEGTKAYLQTVTDKQYQRYPTTFLNNQSYLDIDEFKNIAKQKMSKLRGNDGIDLNSQYEKDLTEHLGF